MAYYKNGDRMTRKQNDSSGAAVLNIQDKTFDVSANICDINWNRRPSTLPNTCLVRVIIQVSAQHDSVPDLTLRKAIVDDIQKRYRVTPHDFSITDLKLKLV